MTEVKSDILVAEVELSEVDDISIECRHTERIISSVTL